MANNVRVLPKLGVSRIAVPLSFGQLKALEQLRAHGRYGDTMQDVLRFAVAQFLERFDWDERA